MQNFALPASVVGVIDRLEAAGFEAYIVGGSVRDLLCGTAPHDFDITTSALPTEMQRVFSDVRTVETGLRHGTLTVLFDGDPIEVTTYRVDGDYTDRRRPDSVSFTPSLLEDLARRDLTVNAMAYSPRRGLVDPFGGRGDLKAQCLRAVGDPERRFTEDALRILRVLRFASTLDYMIEGKTAAAVRAMAHTVRFVAAERIREELFRLVLGKGALRILSDYREVLSEVLPEASPHPALNELPDTLPIRLAALLFGSGVKSAEAALLRLRIDRATLDATLALCRLATAPITAERPVLCRLLRREGEIAVTGALRLRSALGYDDSAATRLVAEILRTGAPYRLSDLAIGGRELKSIGVPSGPHLGALLEALYGAVIAGTVQNHAEALLSYASELYRESDPDRVLRSLIR